MRSYFQRVAIIKEQADQTAFGQVARGKLEVKTSLEEVKEIFSHYSFPIVSEDMTNETVF